MDKILAKLATLWQSVALPIYQPLYDEIVSDLKNLEIKPKKKVAARDFTDVAVRMIQIYKESTKGVDSQRGVPWVAGLTLIKARLESPNIDLSKYSDDDIIDATQRYINVADKTYKRVLKYFIWKEDKGGFCSDLIEYLDNPELNKSYENEPVNWLYN